MKKVLVWGASGQLKVLRPIIENLPGKIVSVLDNDESIIPVFTDLPFILGQSDIDGWLKEVQLNSLAEFFTVAVGRIGTDRVQLSYKLSALGLKPITLIHEQAWVAKSARLGAGCQVMAMASVCEGVEIGPQTIINTQANIDHDCKVGTGVHIMPGAMIAGEVKIKSNVAIGSNATVLPRLTIGESAIVGAGAVVTHDLPPNVVVAGNPARILDPGDN